MNDINSGFLQGSVHQSARLVDDGSSKQPTLSSSLFQRSMITMHDVHLVGVALFMIVRLVKLTFLPPPSLTRSTLEE